MKLRILNRGPLISNRIALITVLALALTALAGIPGNAAVATKPETAQEEPAAGPVDTVAGKPRFRLLLLRRG